MSQRIPLAVVGLASRFADASNRHVFFENILADRYSIRSMPADRFQRELYFDPRIGAYGKSYCDLGGLIQDVPFDPKFFRIPPKVAAATDIAQLWALQVALETIQDANKDPDELRGKHCGVIIGHARGSMLTSDMAFGTAVEGMAAALDQGPGSQSLRAHRQTVIDEIHQRYPARTEDGGPGTIASALAGRIAANFGWTGPHMVVDAACASSFAALDIAARAIRSGRMPMALVGGASYSQELSVILFAQSRALSPNGSFPFDERADGFISSDGIGFLLIMPLCEALAQGYEVRAVLRGIGGSCDGKGKALWAPRKEGQVLAMQRAYDAAKIDPASIDLIEAHATSTSIGDATEVDALHDVFSAHRKNRESLLIGSVKGNIGHCREAAGIAGLIKVIQALDAKTIPPSGNFRTANPDIPFKDRCVQVSEEPREWKSRAGPRRAGCNAFGIGGLNYHVIVEEAPTKLMPIKSQRTIPSVQTPRDIAIVGLGLRVAQSNTPDQFWTHLLQKEQLFCEVPQDRWSSKIYHSPGERKTYRSYANRGGFITDFKADWRRYRVPPKLVERNDPLQFMLLDSALDAFEDANIDLTSIDREKVAVVIGTVFGSDYALQLSLSIRARELAKAFANREGRGQEQNYIDELAETFRVDLPSINEDSSGSLSSSTLASRIAKTLDLMGPTFAVDAACASSLASLEIACDYLQSGEVDCVVYGGGDRAMRVQRYEGYCQFYAISKHESPRPFDESSDGFFPGEGAAICVLKRAEDARRDGDRIYAIIKGIGGSSDGERKSLYKPSADGLSLAMTRALEQSQVPAREIGFIECHGGGTPSGDATETEAIKDIYRKQDCEAELLIGTVKANIGHTQGASGAISIAKTALAISKQTVPPQAGFERAALGHGFDSNFHINRKVRAFPKNQSKAAVSAMGLGGINYHVVMEGPADERRSHDHVFTICAPSRSELQSRLKLVRAETLYSEPEQGDGPFICVLTAGSEKDLQTRLETAIKAGFLSGTRDFLARQGIFISAELSQLKSHTCFMFSGQGSQYVGMHRALFDAYQSVRDLVNDIDAWLEQLRPSTQTRIKDIIFSRGANFDDIFTVQVSILAADLIAYTALKSEGLQADVVTGHSFGDYAALVVAEAWSLEDALRATWARAQAIGSTVEEGAMLSVIATAHEVNEVIRAIASPSCLECSNRNAPKQTVLSGSLESIASAESAFSKLGIETVRLPIPRAFHSSLMRAAEEPLAEALSNISIVAPRLKYLSSVTGEFEIDPLKIKASLITQLTRPVNFLGQIETLLAANINTFVECGPRGVLASLTRQIVNEARRGGDIDVMSTDDGERPGPWAVARVLAMVKRRDLDSLRSEIPESDTPASPYTPTESFIVLDDESSAHIRQSDGFEEFWESTKPAVAQLVHNLWESYQTQRPRVSRESDDTAIEGFVETQTPFPLNDERPGREEIQAFLLEALCEETGYPPDIIEVDADLEADLGIDTVKQAQVLGKVRDRYQLKADQGLSLSDFPTLGHIVDFVLQSINDRPAPSATQVAVPMVDITKRRSQTPLRSEKEIPIPLKRMETKTVRRESKFDEVQVLELSGTAYEIGRAHGEALREEIKDIIARYEDFLGEKGLSMVALPEATRTLPKLFDASSLEEIRGIAEGVGLPLAYLVAYNLDTALFPAFTTGCTQAIRTAEANQGTLLHLTNEDSPLRLHLGGRHPRVIQIRRRSDGPHPGRTTVHFSLAGQLCGPNAVNDAGLTVTACTLLDRAPPTGLPTGIPHPQLVKRIVEEASTLQEAMQIAKRSRRSGRWGMLISDADRDEAAYLEYDGDQVLLEGRVPGTWVSANHAISGPAPKQTPPEHSIHRAEQAAHLIRGVEALNLEKAKRILRDQYDRARKREVEHATMNTVCRVDNVMSLIVEGKARRLHVTRNVGAGPNSGAFEFMTIDYSPGHQVDSLENINESGRGLVACDEVMHRHLIRVMPEPQSGDIERAFFPSLVLLVGEGPRIEAIGDALRDRAASVHIAANFEAAHTLFDSLGGARKIDAIGIVLSAAKERKAWNLSDEDWQTRRSAAITGPFKLLKRFLPFRDDAKIFAVTVLGGALGFDNIVQGSPENGGLLGLFKAIRREFDSAQVQVLDTSPSAGAAQVAKALLQELDGGSKRLEVGLLRKSRIRLTMAPRAIRDSAKELDALPASWIITGGARGVTASIAKRLSKLYQPQLFLVGRHVLPESTEVLRLIELSPQKLSAHKDAILTEMKSAPDFTPLLWTQACEEIDKTVEIARNIEEMKSSGSRVQYFSVDIGDRVAFSKVITAIRDRGKIEAIIHGAGYELAKTFENKTDDILKKTMSKADGLVNLLALCAQDSLSHFALFSSVVGRFGGHGQTDYAMANEVSARILGTFRAGRPEVKTCCFTWPAWSEVGMAARSSSRVFLENTGQKFMPPEEGANHFIRELWDGFSELEVVICDELGALDLDGLLPRQSDLRRWRQINEQTRGKPLISSVVHYESDQHLIVEREISASEPFLDQHRMGAVPILPAVAGLEMMLEMLSLTPGNWTLADVEIVHPLKVKEGNRASVRVILEDGALRVVASARRPDGVMLEPERVHLRARRVEQQAMQKRARPSWSGPASPFPYPRQIDRTPGSRLMYHGPVFRCLQGVLPNEHGGTAKLVIPPPEALVENSLRDRWVLNSALLDGCLQAAGLLGRMKYALSALPVGFGRIDFSQRCTVSVGETVYLDVHIRRTSEEQLESDLYLFGESGLLLSVKSYRSLVVRGVR